MDLSFGPDEDNLIDIWQVLAMGQCGDPGKDVLVIADRYFEKLGSIADQGPQARGLQW